MASWRRGSSLAMISEPETAIDSQPYIGRPYWQKPASLTWGEWATKGGLTPRWYSKEFDEYKYA